MRLRSLLCAAFAALPCHAQDAIGITWFGDVSRIDTVSFAQTPLGPSGFSQCNSMAHIGGRTVVMAGPNLIEINPITGTGSLIATTTPALDGVRALAAIGSTLYAAYTTATGAPLELHTIDTSTGTTSFIGILTSTSGVQGMAGHPDGTLYALTSASGLMTIDPATAVMTDVNPASGGASALDFQFLAASPDGDLWGGKSRVFEINRTNGAATQISPNGSGTSLGDLRGFDFLKATPIWDNGPTITSTGGPGSSRISEVQTSLGMGTLGWAADHAQQQSALDDFFTDGSVQVNCVRLYCYVDQATSPAITGVHIEIYDGDPQAGGTPVAGSPGLANNLFTTTGYDCSVDMAGIHRVLDTTPANTDRQLQRVTVQIDTPISLDSTTLANGGPYWIEFAFEGTGTPMVVPTTTLGVNTTGNAKAIDSGVATALFDVGPQALPFTLFGESAGLAARIKNLGGSCGSGLARLDVRGSPVAGGTLLCEWTGIGSTAPVVFFGFTDPDSNFPALGCLCRLHAMPDVFALPSMRQEIRLPNVPQAMQFELFVQGVRFDLNPTALACQFAQSLELSDGYSVRLW